MQVSLQKIFKSFLDSYIKIHFEISNNATGLTTNTTNKERFTVSKHSHTITHWFYDELGKNFEEYQIVKNRGNIEIQKEHKTVMKFSCPTEPLTLK